MYIYLVVYKQMIDVKLLLLYTNTWNHFTMCQKMSLGSFKNVISKMCLQIIYVFEIYIYTQDLASTKPICWLE